MTSFRIESEEKGPILTITGENLDLAATASDYRVKVGVSEEACKMPQLSRTELVCQLDSRLPEALPGAPVFREQSVPEVVVKNYSILSFTME